MTGNFVFPAVEKLRSCAEYNFPEVFEKTNKSRGLERTADGSDQSWLASSGSSSLC